MNFFKEFLKYFNKVKIFKNHKIVFVLKFNFKFNLKILKVIF